MYVIRATWNVIRRLWNVTCRVWDVASYKVWSLDALARMIR